MRITAHETDPQAELDGTRKPKKGGKHFDAIAAELREQGATGNAIIVEGPSHD